MGQLKRLKTTAQFIFDAKLIHGNKFDYSKVDYVNDKTNVKIICPIHGAFNQKASNHLQNRGCMDCGIEASKRKRRKTQADFLSEAHLIHDDKFDYSEVDYKSVKQKIKLKCLICDFSFKQTPEAHLRGQGCPCCFGKNKTTEVFVLEAKIIHGDKFNYSEVDYIDATTKVKIICSIHGIFNQTPNNHLFGQGCKKCNESKGEMVISKYLDVECIKYLSEHRFEKCRNIKPLIFDFYLPQQNLCIEYDGIQHFKINERFGGQEAFEKLKINDNIKNQYCLDNGIKLIRIPYYDFDNIEKILKRELV